MSWTLNDNTLKPSPFACMSQMIAPDIVSKLRSLHRPQTQWVLGQVTQGYAEQPLITQTSALSESL